MRKTVSMLLLTFSMSAFSEDPSYFPSEVTCAELKADLQNYGSVKIKTKRLWWTTKLTFHQSVKCTGEQFKQLGLFKTSDGMNCRAGERCQKEITNERPENFPRCELNQNC